MLEDGDIAAHPRMNIALQGDGDLFASEGGVYTGARCLGLIPFAIVAGCGMYVMCRSVIIHNVELLIRTQTDNVRGMHATLLPHPDVLRRAINGAVYLCFRDKSHEVLQ